MNELWLQFVLPYLLLLGRIGAFFMALPIFGWNSLPMVVRAGLAVVVTACYGVIAPPSLPTQARASLGVFGLLMVQELATGLALGLAAHFVFLAIQQGARIMGLTMGFSEAGIIDPAMGEESEAIGMFFEMTFVLLFLVVGGHHLLLKIIFRSYEIFPAGQPPAPGVLAEALVQAGSTMLLFGLRFAAPVLAGFLVLGVVLAVLARAMPEMNILFESFPLRVGLGLLLAAAIVPTLGSFTNLLAQWMNQYLMPG